MRKLCYIGFQKCSTQLTRLEPTRIYRVGLVWVWQEIRMIPTRPAKKGLVRVNTPNQNRLYFITSILDNIF